MMSQIAIALALGLCGAIAQTAPPPGSSPGTFVVAQMNVGGQALPDIGYVAEKTEYIQGPTGFTFTSTIPVDGADNAAVYLTERVSTSTLTYVIPAPKGEYTVTSMHAESYFSNIGERVFNIEINSEPVRTGLDVFAEVGQNVALNLDFENIKPVNGSITVKFVNVVEKALVNGIRIVGTRNDLPSCTSGGESDIIKLNAGGEALPGIGFRADNTSLLVGSQGLTYTSFLPVTGDTGDNAQVYLTERYAFALALKYRIPVEFPGTYTVKTLHSESFFNSAGIRRFSVEINGERTETAVDIFARVGKNRALVLSHTTEVAAPGFLEIIFRKVSEFPLVNGIIVSACHGPAASPMMPSAEPMLPSAEPMMPSTEPEPVVPSSEPDVSTPPTPTPVVESPLPPTPVVESPGAEPIESEAPLIPVSPEPLLPQTAVKINVGGPALPDDGFLADDLALIAGPAGRTYRSNEPVTALGLPAESFQTIRYTKDERLTYRLRVTPGKYTVSTLHAESYFMTGGRRTFGISINGETKASGIDIAAEVGVDVALVKQFDGIMPVDGFITISLVKELQNPLLTGLIIEPMAEPTTTPEPTGPVVVN